MKILENLLAFCLLLSCTVDQKMDNEVFNPRIEVIKDSKGERFSQLIKEFKIIPINYSPLNIVGRIDKLVEDKDEFLLLDYKDQSIKRIDCNGKFKNKISHQGRAAGEYLRLDDFIVHPLTKEIIVLDGLGKKLIFFNGNGEFLREFKIPMMGRFISYLNHENLVIFCPRTPADGDPPYYIVNVVNFKGEVTQRYLPYTYPTTAWILSREHLQENQGDVIINCFLDYHVYKIGEDLNFDTLALFDYGAYSFDTTNLASINRGIMKRVQQGGGTYGLGDLFLFGQSGLLLSRIGEDTYWACGNLNQDFKLSKREKERYLDFFHGWPVVEPMGKIGDMLVTWIEPVYLIELWEKYPDQRKEALSYPEYREIIDKLTVDGNPVLFFYRIF